MKKLPWILLGLSITFNFAFTGSFLEARGRASGLTAAGDDGGGVAVVADQLELDRTQREKFSALRKDSRELTGDLDRAIHLARQDLWETMDDASASDEDIEAAQAELDELHRQGREARVRHFRGFLGVLRPEQREDVFKRMRKHGHRGPAWRHLLDLYDADDDGTLSEPERDRAREAVGRHGRPGSFGSGRGGPGRGGPGAGSGTPSGRGGRGAGPGASPGPGRRGGGMPGSFPRHHRPAKGGGKDGR